jgi:hypothetical protein
VTAVAIAEHQMMRVPRSPRWGSGGLPARLSPDDAMRILSMPGLGGLTFALP